MTRESLASCIDYYKLNIDLLYLYIICEMHTCGEKLALKDIYLYWYYFRSGDRAIEPKIRYTLSTLITI